MVDGIGLAAGQQTTREQTAGLTKEQFMELTSHFEMSRYRRYDVPKYVIAACYDTLVSEGSMEPLWCYDRAMCFYWRATERPMVAGTRTLHGAEELSQVKAFLQGKGYWKPESILTQQEIDVIAEYVYARAVTIEEHDARMKSYPVRRRKACGVINNKKLRETVFKRDGHKCRKCKSRENLSVDHIVSVLRGGDDSPGNLQTLCRSCNSSKGARE